MEVAFFSPTFWFFAEKHSSMFCSDFSAKVPDFLNLYFDYLLQYSLEGNCSLEVFLEELKMLKSMALRWGEVLIK